MGMPCASFRGLKDITSRSNFKLSRTTLPNTQQQWNLREHIKHPKVKTKAASAYTKAHHTLFC